jgi:hypothetical protein
VYEAPGVWIAAQKEADARTEAASPRSPISYLDRRASNALLIAEARAAIAQGCRTIEVSEQLIRQSAKLMPRSYLEAPTEMPRERDRQAGADREARRQTNEERQKTRAVQQVGYSLRSMAEETCVMSQELGGKSRPRG